MRLNSSLVVQEIDFNELQLLKSEFAQMKANYVSYIRQSNKWYHCDDKHITETNLLTLSNNVYLMFYAKEVDLGT